MIVLFLSLVEILFLICMYVCNLKSISNVKFFFLNQGISLASSFIPKTDKPSFKIGGSMAMTVL